MDVICHPNDLVGLGSQDLKVIKIVILSKWFFKLVTKDRVSQNLR